MTSLAPTDLGGRNNSASLRRALAILLQLGEDSHGEGFTVAELCTLLEMNKSTLLRLLVPLCDARLAEHSPVTGRYRLGWRNAQLGQSYLDSLDLGSSMKDILQKLTADTNETTHLVISDIPEVIYVDKVDSLHAVRMFSRIGNHSPMHCTSVGKAILAFADDAAIEKVVAFGLAKRTPNTRTTEAELRTDLVLIRERGYAVDDVENEPGIRCVAAPIFDRTGAVTAAVSVSGPVARVTRGRVPELGQLVIGAAAAVSERLGARR